MLVPNKMQHVICTGNLGSKQQYEELRQLAPNVHVVAGDCDDLDQSSLQMVFPETKVICIGEFRIGVIHGHQILPWGDHLSLATMRRKLNVDVLISGHTHKNEVVEHDGHYHINPGSITGAFSEYTNNATTTSASTVVSTSAASTGGMNEVSPSFALLAVQGSKVICYVYELIDGEVEVFKTEFSK